MPHHPVVHVEYPSWVDDVVNWNRRYSTDEEKMRLAVAVARENVERETGGPFGAAILERGTGRVVAVGMNSVVRLNNSTLHGEIVAFMMAQQRVGSYTLNSPGAPVHELFTSCEPCAMCLGAAREDAARLNFEEGPVFEASYRYVEERGLAVTGPVLREEAREVLELYRARRGTIYNA